MGANVRVRKAADAKPQKVVVDGSLMFKVKDGKRVGCQRGDGKVVGVTSQTHLYLGWKD